MNTDISLKSAEITDFNSSDLTLYDGSVRRSAVLEAYTTSHQTSFEAEQFGAATAALLLELRQEIPVLLRCVASGGIPSHTRSLIRTIVKSAMK